MAVSVNGRSTVDYCWLLGLSPAPLHDFKEKKCREKVEEKWMNEWINVLCKRISVLVFSVIHHSSCLSRLPVLNSRSPVTTAQSRGLPLRGATIWTTWSLSLLSHRCSCRRPPWTHMRTPRFNLLTLQTWQKITSEWMSNGEMIFTQTAQVPRWREISDRHRRKLRPPLLQVPGQSEGTRAWQTAATGSLVQVPDICTALVSPQRTGLHGSCRSDGGHTHTHTYFYQNIKACHI